MKIASILCTDAGSNRLNERQGLWLMGIQSFLGTHLSLELVDSRAAEKAGQARQLLAGTDLRTDTFFPFDAKAMARVLNPDKNGIHDSYNTASRPPKGTPVVTSEHILPDSAFAAATWIMCTGGEQLEFDVRRLLHVNSNEYRATLYDTPLRAGVETKIQACRKMASTDITSPMAEDWNEQLVVAESVFETLKKRGYTPSRQVRESLFPKKAGFPLLYRSTGFAVGAVRIAQHFAANSETRNAALALTMRTLEFYAELESHLGTTNTTTKSIISALEASLKNESPETGPAGSFVKKLNRFATQMADELPVETHDKQGAVTDLLAHNAKEFSRSSDTVNGLLLVTMRLAADASPHDATAKNILERSKKLLTSRLDDILHNSSSTYLPALLYLITFANDSNTTKQVLDKCAEHRIGGKEYKDDTSSINLTLAKMASTIYQDNEKKPFSQQFLEQIPDIIAPVLTENPILSADLLNFVLAELPAGHSKVQTAGDMLIGMLGQLQGKVYPSTLAHYALQVAQNTSDPVLFRKAMDQVDAFLPDLNGEAFNNSTVHKTFGTKARDFSVLSVGLAIIEKPEKPVYGALYTAHIHPKRNRWANLLLDSVPGVINNMREYQSYHYSPAAQIGTTIQDENANHPLKPWKFDDSVARAITDSTVHIFKDTTYPAETRRRALEQSIYILKDTDFFTLESTIDKTEQLLDVLSDDISTSQIRTTVADNLKQRLNNDKQQHGTASIMRTVNFWSLSTNSKAKPEARHVIDGIVHDLCADSTDAEVIKLHREYRNRRNPTQEQPRTPASPNNGCQPKN